MEYVKIRSWHMVRFWTRVPHSFVTLCGRKGKGESRTDFEGEKSCETCLRIFAKESE